MDDARDAEERQCCSSVGPQHERNCCTELALLVKQEVALRCCSDHMALAAARAPSNLVWREKVCQWCYDVIDHLGASRDIVFIAMNIFDRYCVVESSTKFSRDEIAYELAAMTGLFLALRLSGRSGLRAPDIARMSRKGIKVQDIAKMGNSMIEKLSWNCHMPTPVNFVQGFISLLPPSVDADTRRSLLESATYLAEISVCDSFFSGVDPSKIAFVAVISASGGDGTRRINENERKELYNEIQAKTGLRRDSPELRGLRSKLHHIYTQSEDNDSGSPHVIPNSESDNKGVLLSRPVNMRVVSSDNVHTNALQLHREVSHPTHVFNARKKRSVSPAPQEEKPSKRTKRLLASY